MQGVWVQSLVGEWRSHPYALGPKIQHIKQKQHNKLNKDLKMCCPFLRKEEVKGNLALKVSLHLPTTLRDNPTSCVSLFSLCSNLILEYPKPVPELAWWYWFQKRVPEPSSPHLTLWIPLALDFSGDSDVKESTCNAGDLGSVPRLGRSPGGGHATHSSILAWEDPWTEEPGRLHSMGSQRVGH